jgi:hypothetical protein
MCAMRRLPVGLLCRSHARLRRRANQNDLSAHPASMTEGRIAIVTRRGKRDAVDVSMLQRDLFAPTNNIDAYGQVAWS